MNRRQKWDRNLENILLESGREETGFQNEKEEEDRRRMKWDQEHAGLPVVNEEQPRPVTSPREIDPKRGIPLSLWSLSLKRSKRRK
jgi:hypothetical protein